VIVNESKMRILAGKSNSLKGKNKVKHSKKPERGNSDE
jgi:hypothetical protein